MDGRAEAPAAGTVLNALATGTGSAFAIDRTVRATVSLDDSVGVTGEVAGAPGLDPDEEPDASLIERCVEITTAKHGDGQGGTVRTESEVPLAAGLKSSSAAANAAVLATLDALGIAADPAESSGSGESGGSAVDPLAACRLGVRAAREVDVTVTGAFDDASASMLGGLTVTDNEDDELLVRDEPDWAVLVWTPPRRAYSAEADVDRCRRIAPVADLVADLALSGEYGTAMTVNGLAYAAALGYPAEPMMEALPGARGVSLSGTGPSVVAVGDPDRLADAREAWERRDGDTWLTTTRTTGARTV